MKGFGKRLGILAACMLLACAMIVTASAASAENCPGSCTHQAAVGSTHYDTLEEAVAAAASGSSVTLLSDITVSSPITIEKSLSLDLGGKTLTGAPASDAQAAVTFTKGGAVRNGKILASKGTAVLVQDCTVAIEKNAQLDGCGTAPTVRLTASKDQTAKLNLSGTLSGSGPAAVIDAVSEEGSCELYVLKNAKLTADSNAAIAFDCAGKLDISDGTIQAKKNLLTVHIARQRETELTITGGKLLSEAGEAIVITTDADADAPKDFVTGGTFQKAPAAYIPSYCKIQENSDGTYTVISSYTLTFQSGGATGTMDAVTVKCGSTYQLPKCGFTAPSGMDFAGWSINGKTYAAGASYTPAGNVTVTALWKTHTHTGGKSTCLSKAVCATCGQSYGKLGSHSLAYVSGSAATCSKTGMKEHKECTVCGSCFVSGTAVSAYSLSTPALGHSWETVEGTPVTCTEDGLKEHSKCSECGALQADGKTVTEEDLLIPATGHTMEEVAASQATCTEPGIQAHQFCTTCDEQFVEGEPVEISQLTTATSSHVLSDWLSDEYYHWKTCVDCDEVFRQSGHADADADGACDDCGYAMAEEQAEAVTADGSGFSWLFLIPILAAIVILILLIMKKRKEKE